MKISTFFELMVWQKAKAFIIQLYQLNKSQNHSFNNQLFSAGLSISNNIAEGFGRYSPREFIRFLNIAKGSNDEVQSMLLIGQELGYFKEEDLDVLLEKSVEINMMIIGLIKSLKTKTYKKI